MFSQNMFKNGLNMGLPQLVIFENYNWKQYFISVSYEAKFILFIE